MPLEINKPKIKQKRLKLLIYGNGGLGKSYLSCQFPDPFYIDTEQGVEYPQFINLLNQHKYSNVLDTADYDKILKQVMCLMTEKHNFKTLVIDTLTRPFEILCAINEHKKGISLKFQGHVKEAEKQIKNLAWLLLRLDMNVILTAHEKTDWQNGEAIGTTFHGPQALRNIFDLTVNVKEIANQLTGFVIKTRIEEFPRFSQFPFEYQTFVERCGKNLLEKDTSIEVLATSKQLAELIKLVDLMKVSEEICQKWISNEGCISFEQMNTKTIQKYIDALKKKILNPSKGEN